jgi:hypothetical protein
VLQLQLAAASVSLLRTLELAVFQSQLAAGADPTTAQFLGLPGYMGVAAFASQTVTFSASSGSPMLEGLNHIEALCQPSDEGFGSRPDVFVMSSRGRARLIRDLHLRGVCPDFSHCPLTNRKQLHHNGIPVLTGRVRETHESGDPAVPGVTEAWALKLTGVSGIHVLHLGGEPSNFGLRMEERTTVVQTAAAGAAASEAQNASRGIEVFGLYSLVVPEVQSVARLVGIPVDLPTYPALP